MGQQINERPVVLVVEDEFLIRMDAVDMVRTAGFDAVEASDADGCPVFGTSQGQCK